MPSEECTICCSEFNKSVRKPIQCNNCHFKACSACNKQFILGTNSEVKCMNCNAAWSMNFLYTNFPMKFVSQYRCHRRTILWNKELYNAPQVAEYIGHKSCYDKNALVKEAYKDRISEKKKEYKNLKGKRGKPVTEERKKIRKEQKKLEAEYSEVVRESNFFYQNYHRVYDNYVRNSHQSSKSSYHRPCIQENCRGFLDSKGDCPICHARICLDCNIVKDTEEHECKQDDVSTWQELKKNTRPCPKCNVRIHKISGCDQMWCVQCNTAFSWRRGTIEHGNVHNPHYFDWLFQGGAVNPPPVARGECNENVFPHITRLQSHLQNQTTYSHQILRMYRFFLHIAHVEIPKFQLNPVKHRTSTFNYLVRHVKGEKDIEKLYERFLLREHLCNEFATILENYKQQQLHFFHALLNNTLNNEEFMKRSEDLNMLYKNAFREFNTFYKRKYNVSLDIISD